MKKTGCPKIVGLEDVSPFMVLMLRTVVKSKEHHVLVGGMMTDAGEEAGESAIISNRRPCCKLITFHNDHPPAPLQPSYGTMLHILYGIPF